MSRQLFAYQPAGWTPGAVRSHAFAEPRSSKRWPGLVLAVLLMAGLLSLPAAAAASSSEVNVQDSDPASPAAVETTVFTTLTFPGATNTGVRGITPQGDIVGQYRDSLSLCNHGFLRDDHGTYSKLTTAPGPNTFASGINPAGDIVGYYSSACPASGGGPPPCPGCRGYLLSAGNLTAIDFRGDPSSNTRVQGINSRGDVVGRYTSSDNHVHGFLRSSSGTYTSIDFPGANLTQAFGINARGAIVGFYSENAAPLGCAPCHPFLRTSAGTYTTLTVAAAGASTRVLARGVNNRGDIVGAYDAPNGNGVPFLLERNGTSLSLAVPPGVPPGTADSDAFGINAPGNIVGDYPDSSGMGHGYLLVGAR